MEFINSFLFLTGALLFFSIIATTLSARVGLPFLLIFLFVGMLAGEDGIGRIKFDNFYLAGFISQLCLAIILLDGGLNTKLSSVKRVFRPAVMLATWGVLATVLSLGLFTTLLFPTHFSWKMGFLIAAILGSTDAASVFSLLRNSGVRLVEKVKATLEIESGTNDPMGILLVSIFIELILRPETMGLISILYMLLQQLVLGIILGLLGGALLGSLLVRINLPQGLYALLILSGGLLVFTLTNSVGGSGFLAIYISGVLLGNLQRHKVHYILSVTDGLAWLAQASMFLVLGLLVSPARLLDCLGEALGIALFLILIARPFAVWTSLSFFDFTRNEKHFISWVGLRGAVPVALSILPVLMGMKDAYFLFDIGFTIVVLSLLVQGTSIPLVARWLGVILPIKFEAESTQTIWVGDKSAVDLFGYKVKAKSRVINKNPLTALGGLEEEGARFFTMLRDNQVVEVQPETRVQEKDFLWYVAPASISGRLARLFNNTERELKENLKFYGEFTVAPDALMRELAEAYGFEPEIGYSEWTVGTYLKRKLKNLPTAGDRIALGQGFYLTVKETDEVNQISQIYLKIPSQ
ncbi:MAG: potassium/proton antiporter [Neisseriaceae bacterium]